MVRRAVVEVLGREACNRETLRTLATGWLPLPRKGGMLAVSVVALLISHINIYMSTIAAQ